MRKLAIAVGVSAALLFAGGVAWKADATTWRTGTLNLPHRSEGLFADREDRLHRLGPPLPAGIPLVLWPRPMLMQALLA
jgi:hypothetical protein